MVVIEIKFLTGRFHATPWGRHVNEGVPEWPPSPYRLVRSLYDVWKRKRPEWPATRVEPLLGALAATPPYFRLPPASTSHTRAFLSENTKDVTARQKVFDAFVVLDPWSKVLMGWPNVELDSNAQNDLNELLVLLNYLGRSESWVEARIHTEVSNEEWNCIPTDDMKRGEGFETVGLACPVSVEAYAAQPYKAASSGKGKNPKPVSWVEALAWSTSDLLASRCSEPPTLQYIPYHRSANCFQVNPAIRSNSRNPVIHGVLYGLDSKVLPQVITTLEMAERLRRKLMGIHKRIVGESAQVSSKFSGKDAQGRPLQGHRHAYILPLDRDRDGRLDHVLIACKEPLDHHERLALDHLHSIWQTKGKPDIQCIPLQWGTLPQLFHQATRFTSTTPFVPPRHYRKGRGPFVEWVRKEVRREAIHHGLPPPTEVRLISRLGTRSRDVHWIEFRRNRKEDPSQLGYGFELIFSEPVTGPVALGYGCHFGLGQFTPADEEGGTHPSKVESLAC